MRMGKMKELAYLVNIHIVFVFVFYLAENKLATLVGWAIKYTNCFSVEG